MFLPSNMTLSPGDSGEFVRELQRRLSSLNLYPSEALSGFYDGTTTSAVTSFQFQNGLRSDGVAGPETLRRLNGVLSGTADSTPAPTTQPAEDVMKTMYMVDHMLPQEAEANPQSHDAFTFQPPAPSEPQIAPVQAAPQAFVPPAPTQLQQPIIAQAPAIDPFAAAVAQQQQSFVPPAPSQQPAAVPQPMKPIDAMLQPTPQPEKPLEPQAEKPFQPPKPSQPLAPTGQLVKPIDAMLQPAPQPEKPLEPQVEKPFQPPKPAFIDKPAELKPLDQPIAAQPQQKPLEQPMRPPEPRMDQQPELAQKPAAPTAPESEQAAPERQSLRQRFSGMMQRIADYMESKLPQSVQAEVQKIGMQMAERGIREIPIPPNETALPSPTATPGRGQQQVER